MNHNHDPYEARLDTIERIALSAVQLIPWLGIAMIWHLHDTGHPQAATRRPYFFGIAMFWHGLALGTLATWNALLNHA